MRKSSAWIERVAIAGWFAAAVSVAVVLELELEQRDARLGRGADRRRGDATPVRRRDAER